jgi:transposase-like protein
MASKGQKFKQWTTEEKYKIIIPLINMEKGLCSYAEEIGINSGLLYSWLKKYRENGIEGLNNKRKPGNPLSKYANKKKLTKEEQLE